MSKKFNFYLIEQSLKVRGIQKHAYFKSSVGLKACAWNEKVVGSIHIAHSDLETQHRYEAPGNLWVETVVTGND